MLDYTAEPGKKQPAEALKGTNPESAHFHKAPRVVRGVPLAPFGTTEQVLWLNVCQNDDCGTFYACCLVYILYTLGKDVQDMRAAGVVDEESRWETAVINWHLKHPSRALARAAVSTWQTKMKFTVKELRELTETVGEITEEARKGELESSHSEKESEGSVGKSRRRQPRS